MKLSYRTERNAKAISAIWGRVPDGKPCYRIENAGDDETTLFLFDVLGWPFNDINVIIKDLATVKSQSLLVRINSPGGDVIDSFALYQTLKNHNSTVTTRIEGLAASAASFIALAGDNIQAYPTSLMMVHNSWVFAVGNRFDLREVSDILEKIDTNIQDIYTDKTKIGKREMAQMMRDETWFNAKEMKEKGFVDTIIDGKAAKAQFDLSMFANAPDIFTAAPHEEEPTQRQIEKVLRDAGLSKNKAQAVLAGGWKAMGGEQETQAVIESAQKIINLIGGNKNG